MRQDSQVVQVGARTPLPLEFSVELDASSDLAFDESRADALLTIRARPTSDPPAETAAAEVLIMDKSLSMAGSGKLNEAKRAMCAAVDALRDGTYLGIVAGNHEAEVIYPPDGGLARVDAAVREAARNRVLVQLPGGGTAIGKWLTRADALFATAPVPASGTVRHAVLYTDGKNEHETSEQLDEALAACADRFVCDVRGLGDDWQYDELLRITGALHGTARAVVEISDLTGDFTRLMQQARRILVPRVYLGLGLSSLFRLGFVRQTRPVEADLTGQRQERDGEIHIPLGAWPPEDRQYHVSLRFDPDALPVEEEVRAARVTLRAERADASREPCADTQALIVRRRATPDFRFNPPPSLTQAESLRELGMAMRACADAAQNERWPEADRELALALELAAILGDTERLALLRKVSSIGPDGRPRVRQGMSRGYIQLIGLESARTGAPDSDPVDKTQLPPEGGGPVRRECPRCHAVTTAARPRHCEECGYAFADGAGGAGGQGAGAQGAGAEGSAPEGPGESEGLSRAGGSGRAQGSGRTPGSDRAGDGGPVDAS
ncbi:VWA domain-containing protein [Streptomyces sp. HPF1205]|uniref:vWA domain-containing protein n=1 Tax=Streptomyces sp. HPF1205 TaxID=2873262 RepID=UPI001CED42E5|nr:vWA domain-containing protein [Streptomyces sp. HPF1205]